MHQRFLGLALVAVTLPAALAACGSDAGSGTVGTTGTVSTTGTSGTVSTTGTSGSDAAPANPATGPYLFDQLEPAVDEAELSQLATASVDPPVVVFDRFRIDSNAPISGIRWEGADCRVVEEAPTPVPTSTGFLLTIHPDRADEPDRSTKVAGLGFDISEIEQTLLQTTVQPCGPVTSTWAYHRYTVRLKEPLQLENGRSYWLSIQALTENFGTRWGWRGSASGDGSSLQLREGSLFELSTDRAFALEG